MRQCTWQTLTRYEQAKQHLASIAHIGVNFTYKKAKYALVLPPCPDLCACSVCTQLVDKDSLACACYIESPILPVLHLSMSRQVPTCVMRLTSSVLVFVAEAIGNKQKNHII